MMKLTGKSALVARAASGIGREIALACARDGAHVMLKDTVAGEFTSVQDVAEVAVLFATFPTRALTGQSLIVSHGWCME